MTDFHMPDSFYDPPDDEEPCEHCENAGCKYCDAQMAYDEYCDRLIQAKKDGETT
jgi:hypothetical protein